MKIRTVGDLCDRIDEDMAWRRHELSIFNKQIPPKPCPVQTALLRSSVALLYAHWEGHIKNIAYFYLCYLSSQTLRMDELRPELAAMTVRRKIAAAIPSKRIRVHIDLVRHIREEATSAAKIPNSKEDVRTESNLSYSVLEDILLSIGCDCERYEIYRDLIDEELVNSRNKVAHGEESNIRLPEWEELFRQIMWIIGDISTQVQNSAINKTYHLAHMTPIL